MSGAGVDRIDDVISAIGCGRWQVPMLLVAFAANLIMIDSISSTLLSAPMAFRCSIPVYNNSGTNHTSVDTYTSLQDPAFDQLLMYNSKCLPPANLSALEIRESDSSINKTNLHRRWTGLPTCPEIEYDRSIFTSTVISEFDLVCENYSLRPLFQVMMSVGSFIGCIGAGHIGDKFGRKKATQFGILLGMPACIAIAFVPWYPAVLVLRVVAGFAIRIALLPSCGLALETIPRQYRTLVGMFMGIPYSVGCIAFGGSGYMLRSWRVLQLVITAPFVLALPLSFCVDESPRWLVQRGRGGEAVQILEKAAMQNKVVLSPTFTPLLEKLKMERVLKDSSKPKCFSSLDIRLRIEAFSKYFQSRAMLIILLVTPLVWFLKAILYIGITLNVNNFTSTNPFLYLATQGVIEVIAVLMLTPMTQKIGRRLSIGCGFIIAGVAFMVEMVVPADIYWCKWLLVMIAFFLAGSGYQINFMYAPELFPTAIRTRGFAFVIMAGSLGVITTPFITDLLIKEAWWATSVTLGLAGIIAGSLVFLLPETNNLPLPENIQDVDYRRRCSLGLVDLASELVNDKQSHTVRREV